MLLALPKTLSVGSTPSGALSLALSNPGSDSPKSDNPPARSTSRRETPSHIWLGLPRNENMRELPRHFSDDRRL